MHPQFADGPIASGLSSPPVDGSSAFAAPGYAAEQSDDGTWTIRDVPIFAAHEDPRSGREFSRAWIERAIEAAAARRSEGYLPPLHVRHHGSDAVRSAGHFIPRRVEDRSYQGKTTATLIADLVAVPAEVYREIRDGRLPYVSVEILDTGKAEVDSLALLDHDVPFFRFPLLRVSSEGTTAELFRLSRHEAPALAYQAAGSSAAVLFRLEAHVAEFALDEAKEAAGAALSKFADVVGVVTAALEEAAAALGVSAAEDEEKPEDDEASDPEPEAEDEKSVVDLDANDDEDDKKKDLAVFGADRSPADYAALAGKVAALEGQLKARDDEARLCVAVDAAMESLAIYGVTSSARGEIEAVARDGGEVALSAYAAAVKRHGTQEPPAGWTGELPAIEAADGSPVMRYAERGPDVLAKARDLAAAFDAMPASMRGSQTLDDFISINMNADSLNGTIGGRSS